jgi:hypothetical protein
VLSLAGVLGVLRCVGVAGWLDGSEFWLSRLLVDLENGLAYVSQSD